MAPRVAEYFGAHLRVLLVIEPEVDGEQRQKMMALAKERIEKHAPSAEFICEENMDILQGILRHSRTADLLVMGGFPGDLLGSPFGRSRTQEITERTAGPVLWIREYEEPQTFWSTLLQPLKKEA